jgi:membrane protease YdiL (CAAX protease family)
VILEIIQIIGIFIIPVALMYFNIFSFKYRKHVLLIITAVVILMVLIEKWTLIRLGIRTDNITEAIIPYAICTFIGLIFLLIVSKVFKRERQKGFFKKKFFIYEFMAVSIIQEFMFRGFLFPQLQEIFKNGILIILINVLLFTFMHVIYSNDFISLLTIFLGGIYFASIYYVYPNLILVSISHAILNYVAVLYNFYRIEKTSKGIINR